MKSSNNFLILPSDSEIDETLEETFSSLIILCAGSGTRLGLGYNKMFYYNGQVDVLSMTLIAAEASKASELIIVYNKIDLELIKERLVLVSKPVTLIEGGNTRTDSVRNGLEVVSERSKVIAIHDGARPFVTAKIINRSIYGALKYDSAITAVKSIDAVRVVNSNGILSPQKSDLLIIQTPQSFNAKKIKEAYAIVSGSYDDDCEVFIKVGYVPCFMEGSYLNKKITTPEDLVLLNDNYKIGIGFDVHAFAKNRKLILGGIEIPYEKGLLGHSDADVLIHAIMDAILSASSQPDIGVLFPDNDDKYLGISSIALLNKVLDIINTDFDIVNVSAVVMAEKPKLACRIQNIRANLANCLKIEINQINISATTTEKLGIIGNEQGIAVSAQVLLRKKS